MLKDDLKQFQIETVAKKCQLSMVLAVDLVPHCSSALFSDFRMTSSLGALISPKLMGHKQRAVEVF